MIAKFELSSFGGPVRGDFFLYIFRRHEDEIQVGGFY